MTPQFISNFRKQRPLLCALFLLPFVASGQTLTTLHSFNGYDGQQPVAGPILSGSNLFGTTPSGGLGYGTIYAVNTNGTEFTTLYNFTNGSDGANPRAGLILAGSNLYGTAETGGSGGVGTIFAINTNGTGFTTVHSFAQPIPNSNPPLNGDGINPFAGLIVSGNTLYGTAKGGGLGEQGGVGTVFSVSLDGNDFTTIYTFTGDSGSSPFAGLILSGNVLYGTTRSGGSAGYGTVFAVNIDYDFRGAEFTNLYNFTNGSDGCYPYGALVLLSNVLYGTASQGAIYGNGTVFAVNTDGTGFTNMHNFAGGDGANPNAGLILSSNVLYGTTESGGRSGSGTVFSINTDGTGFTSMYSFHGGDGANPNAGLILSSNILYGAASLGSSSGMGTVFSLTLTPPSLGIAQGGNQVVAYWPAYATNYVLQATTNLASPNWQTVSNGSPIIGVTLTNSPPGAFFRLQSQ
jgi:uncharacterized repeat protein (TIGR03803 family)